MTCNLSSLALVLLTVIYSDGVLPQPEQEGQCIKIRLALEQYDIHQAMNVIANMLSKFDVIQSSAEDYQTLFCMLFEAAKLKYEPQGDVTVEVSLTSARFIFELILNGSAEEALSRIKGRRNGTFVDGDCRDVFCVGINFQRVDVHRLVLSWAVNQYSGNGALSKSFPRESQNVMYWRNKTLSTDPLKREPCTMRREPVRDYYDILEQVGKGDHAVVYRCVEKKSGNVFAARFAKMWVFFQRDHFYEEVNIMNKLSNPGHPSLLTLYEVFENDADFIMIVDCLRDLSEYSCYNPEVHVIIRQICEGLEYMHARNIVHMDVRSRNIMEDPNANETRVKLVDFGSAQEADNIMLKRLESDDGWHDDDYITPEELLNISRGTYTDMWYLGVTTYYILTEHYPSWGSNRSEIDENVKKGRWSHSQTHRNLSSKSLNFIGKLLVPDIKERMTAEQCLKDPWIIGG